MFNEACVAQHLREHRACPICRADCVETKAPELSPLEAWRLEQQDRLALKAAESEAALAERRAEAEQALESFYDARRDEAHARAARNR